MVWKGEQSGTIFVSLSKRDGPVAQLGERLNGIQEVSGSIPLRSTSIDNPGW